MNHLSYAHLATALDVLKKENPENTITLDTGDMFQGSMIAVKRLLDPKGPKLELGVPIDRK